MTGAAEESAARIRVKEAIAVEGRYDKNTLSRILDAVIIETKGFGIFSDRERLALLRRLAEKRGLIIMTDSDGAGFLIRSRIKGAIDPSLLKHAYIPDIPGKEKRKSAPSKEGTLGVEGMSRDVLLKALSLAGATFEDEAAPRGGRITKADLFELGLSGRAGSAGKRQALMKELNLPVKLPANSLLDVLNVLMTYEELLKLCSEREI